MEEQLFNIEQVQQIILGVLNNLEPPNADVPAPVIFAGQQNKKGLSAREVAKNIIARQTEAGAPVGPLPDGEDSISEKMEYIRVQEIIEHIIKNANFKVVIPPGTPIAATGFGADGVPVQVQGFTTNFAVGNAVIQ